jgi:lipopolysaccharide exporter
MSDRKYWLKSGFFTMLHRGTNFFLGFIGFMILVRIFTPAEFGVWVLFISITAIVEMSRNGFLQNGMIKFLAHQDESEERKTQTAALILNTVLTLILMIVLWLAATPLENLFNAPGLGRLLMIYTAILPLLIFHTHNLILMQAKLDFKAYFYAGIAKSLPFFLVILLYYFLGRQVDLPQLAWIQNITFAIAVGVSCFQVRKSFKITWGWFDKNMHQVFHFGKFVFGTNLVSMLTGSLDKFLLGMLLSPAQVALANSAGRVINMIEIPVNSIASIAYPRASAAHDANQAEEVSKIYHHTVGMMLSFTLPFFLVCLLFAEPIILIIAGVDYMDAAPFLRIVAFMCLLSPFDRQSGVILDAIGKPSLNMLMVMGTFVYSIAFNWAFIQLFGLYGAAYAMVAAVLITVVIKQFILCRFLPVQWGSPFILAIKNYPQILEMARRKIGI